MGKKKFHTLLGEKIVELGVFEITVSNKILSRKNISDSLMINFGKDLVNGLKEIRTVRYE